VATTPPRRGAGRIVLIIVGVIAALIGLALLIGGVSGLWLNETKRDDQGYFNSSTERFSTATYAIATDDLDVGNDGPEWLFEAGRLGRVRIRATGQKPVFIGIGRASEVSSYLEGTSYALVKDVDYEPFDVQYEPVPGTGRPGSPAGKDFWVASASGPGTQTLTWDLEGGRWAAVLMNADGSRSVAADVKVGAKISWLIWVVIGLLALGLVVLAAGGSMIYLGTRSRRESTP
jgi:hypothetical protein